MSWLGKPDEVVKRVVFLVSHEASCIIGVDLNIDGGMGQL
jgi:NAD(P)-dependent dehydrogenase (short-subunit alcohol dehydrogenase family)